MTNIREFPHNKSYLPEAGTAVSLIGDSHHLQSETQKKKNVLQFPPTSVFLNPNVFIKSSIND